MNGLLGPSPHLPHNSLPPGSGLGTFSAIAQSPYADARYYRLVFHGNLSCSNSYYKNVNWSILRCFVLYKCMLHLLGYLLKII